MYNIYIYYTYTDMLNTYYNLIDFTLPVYIFSMLTMLL